MEKSITAGLEEYIRTIPGMKEIDAKQCSPLVLAYVGDCVYDLIIKTMVVGRGNRPVHRLHEETSQYVQASAQSFMMRSMQEHLNEEEHGVYRRGRNARSVSPAKNQSITDYRRATGFEALIGHLYLTGQYERLTELVSCLLYTSVFIPVFPGTNCEYDSARAFERAGAKVITKVFRNLDAEDIRGSVDEFEKAIGQAQMIMFPGGFSAGDEPDGSAKFFATAFQNAKIKEAVEKLLNERDGLALGICNGFQALIKLGLVPYGKIVGQTDDAPTLTYNTIGRHI